VTHKWLEDCFVEWRNLTPAQKRYLDYAPGVNYGTVLGDRGVGRVGLKDETESLPEDKELARPKDQPGQPNPAVGKKPDMVHTNNGGLTGTATSMRDALEVDEVEGVLHIAGHPHESHSNTGKGPSLSPTKWGPPRGIKKSPSKNDAPAEVFSAKPKSLPPLDTNTADSLPLKKAQGPPDSVSNAQLPRTDLSPDPAPVMGKSPMRLDLPTKSRPLLTPSTKPTAQPDNDDESIVEVPPMESHAKASRGKRSSVLGTVVVTSSRSMPKVQKPHGASMLRSDKGSTDELGSRNPKGKAKAVYVVDSDEKSDQDVFMSYTKPKSKSKSIVYKGRSRAPPFQGEGENYSHTDEASHKTSSKVDGEKRPTKAKENRTSSTSGSENDNEIKLLASNKVSRTVGSVNKRNRADVLLPSPKRIVSVDLPDPRSLLASQRHGSSPDSTASLFKSTSRLTKPRDRKSSIRVITSATSSSSPKRGRLIIDHNSPSRSPTPPIRRSPRTRSGSTPDPLDVVTFRSDTPPPVQRMSHRHAAITATQRLRNEVMPDVVNFETERRRSTKGGPGRKRKSAQFVASGDDEGEEQTDESRDRKKRKVTTFDDDKGKGKGKPLVRVYAEDSDGPSIRFVANAKARKRLADDDDKPGPDKRSGQGEVRKKIRRDRSVSDYG
jgi:mediator of DNA damage checkpoint protein 1